MKISKEDNDMYHEMIENTYFVRHENDLKRSLAWEKLEDFRNGLSAKYGYDRNNYGVDIYDGLIVKLYSP
jgi:hypothetical protein